MPEVQNEGGARSGDPPAKNTLAEAYAAPAQAQAESQAAAGVPKPIRIFMSAPPPLDDEEARFSSLRVFRHRFRGGIAARLVIDLQKLRNREENYVRCEWSGGRPTKRIVAEYRRWSLSVWQRISDETGQKIMEALQTEARLWEMWIFCPGEAPKKISEIALPRV